MSEIKLKSSSPWIRESHFTVGNLLGQEGLVFCFSEKETMENSIYFLLFDKDFEPVPTESVQIKDEQESHRNVGRQAYMQKQYYCPNEFYIVCSKGIKGYESSLMVFHCVAERSNGSVYNVVVTKADEIKATAIIKIVKDDDLTTVEHFLNEHLTTNLHKFCVSTHVLIQRVKDTVFLEAIGGTEYKRAEVIPRNDGDYYIADNSFKPVASNRTTALCKPTVCFTCNCSGIPIDEGDYVFTSPMQGVIEILQVEHFAHSVYAKFFAVLKSAYVYPRDKEAIQKMFPDFYMEHCVNVWDKEKEKLVKNAVIIPYMPSNSNIGDSIIYKRLNIGKHRTTIDNDGVFHILAAYNGFISSFGSGSYGGIRAEKSSLNATLIEVDGKFKILFYNFSSVVCYNGEHYAKFVYDFETDFFTDFVKQKFSELIYQNAYNGVVYQLFLGLIKPVVVDKERYENFGRNENLNSNLTPIPPMYPQYPNPHQTPGLINM